MDIIDTVNVAEERVFGVTLVQVTIDVDRHTEDPSRVAEVAYEYASDQLAEWYPAQAFTLEPLWRELVTDEVRDLILKVVWRLYIHKNN